MKALRITALSPDLSGCALVTTDRPDPRPGEALVRVGAVSLNFPDLLMTQGLYQLKPELPFTPGMDVAGEIVSAPADSGYAPRDAVVAGTRLGGMAEFVSVPASALRPIPGTLSFPAAAAYGAAYRTAWTALVELGGLKPGQWVLIHGATGGVGAAAVDLAKALGARVIATSGSPRKLERIAEVYAPDATLLAEGRFREGVADATGGVLADLVYDPVGGDVFDESTRCVAFGGKLLVVGFTSGRIPHVDVNIPLIKGFSIVGVRAGEYARRFPERGAAIGEHIDSMLAQGRLSPLIDRVLSLARWREGFSAMANRDLVGKVVFEPGA
ncbi:NADPH:quinone oxidoreductase family protein [Novosphingobium tardum]|uniref:NADPH:quinone oxidoreductase family protein n=1 Tax=Novosphingobium tardum TaxID=1538021 RepID=A0ABV8RQH9_9SPHN